VLAQAAGFGILAAVSPTALLVMAVFLGSANPRRTASTYAAGAVLMTVAMAVAVLYILRAVHLGDARQHEPRYALRFGLGVLALATGAVISWRGRRARTASAGRDGTASTGAGSTGAATAGAATAAGAKQPGFIARMTAAPRPRTAFILGLLLFAPSATFIAAVQVVATANAGVPVTVAGLVIVIVLSVLTVWLPLLTYLAAPDATTRTLRAGNAWLRAYSRTLLTGALVIAGVALVVNGALGVWR
jgi:Sap, sulfolipid-1-addressing protein